MPIPPFINSFKFFKHLHKNDLLEHNIIKDPILHIKPLIAKTAKSQNATGDIRKFYLHTLKLVHSATYFSVYVYCKNMLYDRHYFACVFHPAKFCRIEDNLCNSEGLLGKRPDAG